MALKSCKISKALEANACTTSVAGVSTMAFANWDEDFKTKLTEANSGCGVTAIAGVSFYPVEVADGTGYASFDGTVGANADSKYFMHTVGGSVNHVDCEFLAESKQWLLASVVVAVRTKNGDVYLYGVDNGLRASTFSLGTGTAEGDQTGLSFVYDGAQPEPALKVENWGIISGLFPNA